MNCTHEMKTGSVVTVVNAGGAAGGCSFCVAEQLESERDGYRAALCDLIAAAHGTNIAEAAMEKARAVLTKGKPRRPRAKPTLRNPRMVQRGRGPK